MRGLELHLAPCLEHARDGRHRSLLAKVHREANDACQDGRSVHLASPHPLPLVQPLVHFLLYIYQLEHHFINSWLPWLVFIYSPLSCTHSLDILYHKHMHAQNLSLSLILVSNCLLVSIGMWNLSRLNKFDSSTRCLPKGKKIPFRSYLLPEQ